MSHGTVYIIGAGPGDPELITVKGLACLQNCSIVFHDETIAPALLKHAAKAEDVIAIPAAVAENSDLLNAIITRIIAYASAGKDIAVVAEGDPFIFGLGADIAREIHTHAVHFVVIPGVTSALAAAAYAGIPLTFRGYSSTVAFATGHTDLNKKYTDIDWEKCATGMATFVFFMGIGTLRMIVEKLIAHGRDPRTPVAIISRGTTQNQTTRVASLESLSHLSPKECDAIPVPAIIVVGDVVGLRDELSWFPHDATETLTSSS